MINIIILILLIGLLIPLVYNLLNKSAKVIIINILLILFASVIEIIGIYLIIGISSVVNQILIWALVIIAVVKNIKDCMGEKENVVVFKIICTIIMLLLCYMQKVCMTFDSMPLLETEEEVQEYLVNQRIRNCFFRMMFGIPIINLFIATMFKNKDKKVNQ